MDGLVLKFLKCYIVKYTLHKDINVRIRAGEPELGARELEPGLYF